MKYNGPIGIDGIPARNTYLSPVEQAKSWAAALRSGQYKQAEGVLCRDEFGNEAPFNEADSYCCLGLACAMGFAETPVDQTGTIKQSKFPEDCMGLTRDQKMVLVGLNDQTMRVPNLTDDQKKYFELYGHKVDGDYIFNTVGFTQIGRIIDEFYVPLLCAQETIAEQEAEISGLRATIAGLNEIAEVDTADTADTADPEVEQLKAVVADLRATIAELSEVSVELVVTTRTARLGLTD